MAKSVIVIGASGHGKVIADIVLNCGDTLLGFLDDSVPAGTSVAGAAVLGGVSDYINYTDAYFVIGIGNNSVRKSISERLHGVKWYTAIHPSAVVSTIGVSVGEGTVIMAGAVINPCAVIGRHVIINTCAVVEHDNHIGSFSHLSPNSALCGTVSVGECCHIGAGATVINNLSVCDGTVIGAGGVVVRDINDTGVYAGVPVRRLK